MIPELSDLVGPTLYDPVPFLVAMTFWISNRNGTQLQGTCKVMTWDKSINVNPGSINPERLFNWESTIKSIRWNDYWRSTLLIIINYGLVLSRVDIISIIMMKPSETYETIGKKWGTSDHFWDQKCPRQRQHGHLHSRRGAQNFHGGLRRHLLAEMDRNWISCYGYIQLDIHYN